MLKPSLANSILYETPEQLNQFLQHEQDLDVIDEYGYTPLIEAAIIDSAEKAELILNAGASIDFPDLTGRTALHWSTDNNNLELTQLLLKHGANTNAYSSAGQPVLVMPLLRKQTRLVTLLKEKGASLNFAQDFINAKLLAHRFLLRGRVDIVNPKDELIEIDYEGFYIESSLAFLLHSLQDFINNFQARTLREYFPEIKETIASLNNAAELIKYQHYKINTNEHERQIYSLLDKDLLVIPVAYEGHAISLIKYGDLLVRCDRGEYGKAHGTVIISRMGPNKVMSKRFLTELMYRPLSREFITQEFDKLLNLKTIMTLPLSPQTSGNCSWANIEAALLASVFLLFVKNSPQTSLENFKRAQKKAFLIYDEWQQWDRDRSLDFCIDNLHEANDLHKLSKAAMLTSIFIQQCRYEDLKDFDRAKRILPIITQPKYCYILKAYLDVFSQTQNKKLLNKIENYLDDFGVTL